MLKKFLDILGFLTVIPIGMPDSLEDVAKSMYLFPVVGAVSGLFAATVLYMFSLFLPLSVSTVLGFFALMAFTGLHHLDGLLDFGDALIFRGSVKDRVKIMHDSSVGVGAFATGLFVVLLSVSAAVEFMLGGGSPFLFFIIAESLAKLALIIAGVSGSVAFEGMGSVFIRTLKKSRWQVLPGIVITALITWPLAGSNSLILLVVPFISALSFVTLSKRMINGVSGDVLGSVNEVTRLLGMLVMLWML